MLYGIYIEKNFYIIGEVYLQKFAELCVMTITKFLVFIFIIKIDYSHNKIMKENYKPYVV